MTRFRENVTQFLACWTCFEDKVGRTLGHTHQPCHDLANRDTFFDYACVLFKCFFADFEGEALREKLDNTKEVTLGLSVFVVRFSWVGKHCKYLGY